MTDSIKIVLLFFATASFFSSCSGNDKPVFQLLSSDETGIDFINRIESTDSLNIYDYVYFYNGGGVALGDINNDGLNDLLLTGNIVSSRLYLNKGGLEFDDITQRSGIQTDQWITGATMVDINTDGFLDIYLSSAGSTDPKQRKNLLFVNNGDGTFQEMAEKFGIADTSHTTQAAFFDFDRDGDLDLYSLNHAHEIHNLNAPKTIQADGSAPSTDRLYKNNRKGKFIDISDEAGISYEGYGLGVAISDINRDGWADIYVANDFISNDLMYLNNGDGTFSNNIDQYLYHQSWSGMGNEVADYNNDGLVDIFVLDMLPESNARQKMMAGNLDYQEYRTAASRGYDIQYVRNTLQLNNGNETFSEIGQLAGVDKTDWSWSSLFADFDNDGYKDLFISNGHLKNMTFLDFIIRRRRLMMFKSGSQAEQTLLEELEKIGGIEIVNKVFQNKGDLTFEDKSKDWGFSTPSYSNGAAYGDLDNDGDLDLVVNNINSEAFLYQNRTSEARDSINYLDLRLNGSDHNPGGIGTKVSVYTNGNQQFIEKYVSRGFQSSVSGELHFGLGGISMVDSLKVVWPDDKQQVFKHISPNQTLEINYSEALPSEGNTKIDHEVETLFQKDSTLIPSDIKHTENDFNDFQRNPLLTKMYSRGGPSIAVSDIDDNGLDDVFIGGAAGFSAILLFQQKGGGFRKEQFAQDEKFEDMGAVFFDADSDGDADLYVVSGGSEFIGENGYQDRLYLNDGKGNLMKAEDALPAIISSGSQATAADYDRDGDLDLFVGGRIQPGNYPYPSKSYLLENEGGVFKDVTTTRAPNLQRIGMVSSAIWTDYNNDGWMDLMVVGEWMPITLFHNEKGSFTEVTQSVGLASSHGWWNSVTGGDFDNDGDTDYVAGNIGLNTVYEASSKEPVKGYAGDFDNDRESDFILSRYLQGQSYPVFSLDDMTQQMPNLKYQFPKYSQYAQAQVQDIIPEKKLQESYQVKCTLQQTSFMQNNGDEGFDICPLPIKAQFSPVYGILSRDFDLNGTQDLVLVGNNYHTNPITGRYDASIGLYLKGKGNGEFQTTAESRSGFFADGNTRSIVSVQYLDNPIILVSTNDGPLKSYTLNSLSDQKIKSDNTIIIRRNDAYALIHFANNTKQKIEFLYGNGYLSQSSRRLFLPDSAESVEIVDYKGSRRTIDKETR